MPLSHFFTIQDREIVVKISETWTKNFQKKVFLCVMCVNGLKTRFLGMQIFQAVLDKSQNALVFARFTLNG